MKKTKGNWSVWIIQGIIILYMLFDATGLWVDKVLPKSKEMIEGYSLTFLWPFFIVLVVALVAGYIWLIRYQGKLRVEKVFLYFITIFGLVYMMIMPAYSAPDENSHIPTVYYYSNQLLGKEATDDEGNVMWRKYDDEIMNSKRDQYPTARTYATIFHHLNDKSTDDEVYESSIIKCEPIKVSFLGYIPQILGITLARLFHFGTVKMLLMGKLFILIFYGAIMYAAIKTSPVGKEILATMALLPVSLIQATSYSYDAVVLCASCLFISIVLRIIYEDRYISKKEIFLLAVLIVFMSSIKVVYIAIGFIMFAIPKERFHQSKYKWMIGILILMVGIVSIFLSRFSQVMELSTEATGGYMGEQTYTIGVLCREPIRIFYILYATIRHGISGYMLGILGSRMGWYYITIPYVLQFGFGILLLLSALRREKNERALLKTEKLWILFAVIVCIIGVEAAMLFAYTPYGINTVQGVQGRYFLPVLPLLLVLLKTDKIIVRQECVRWIEMGLYLLQYFSIIYIASYIIESGKGL